MLRSFRLLVVALLLLLTASTAYARTFKIATIAPEGSFWIDEMRKASDTIEKRTDGRVKFRFYPGGVMGNEKSVLRKIRIGQLHGGMFTGGGLEDVSPNLRLYNLPMLFDNLDEVDYVRTRFDPILKKQLEKDGFVSFGFAEGGFGMMLSSTPIHGVEELRGKKVWVPEGDRVYYSAMESLGLSPVPLPITDVLTGLQTGLVDIVGTSPIGALVFQWQTRVKYISPTPLTYIIGVFALDKKSFDKVSKTDQQIVREVMEPLFTVFDQQNRKDNSTAYQTLLDEGIKAVEQEENKIEELRKLTRRSINELNQNSFFDQKLWKEMESYLIEYRQLKK